MKPYLQDPDLTLHCGDALAVLRELEDESVQCCVTSPPYWGLRDYGVDGQVGLEATPDEFVSALVEIFAEVRRVLRNDGTLWLNLGDSYASSSSYNGAQTIATDRGWKQDGDHRPNVYARAAGLKAKDLCMIPARVALALQADGWWLRSEIIWAKPNVMPESVSDRPTRAHEQIYLFAKSERYYFDQEAVREPYKFDGRKSNHVEARDGSIQHREGERWPGARRSGNKERKHGRDVGAPGGTESDLGRGIPWEDDGRGRNVRTVWEIATESSKVAHFAIFPRELARRCIAAGSAEGDVVLDPFMGSGTVAHVARAMARRSIGIELNPDYCALIATRTQQLSLEA